MFGRERDEVRGRYYVVVYSIQKVACSRCVKCTVTGGYSFPRSSLWPVRVKYHLIPHISAQPSLQMPAV